jgi:hypothetical protein
MRSSWIIAMTLCAGCGKAGSDAPRLTPALMPPAAAGLVLGKSTEAEVLAKLPGAKVKKDKSLGGTEGVVQFNDHPIERITTDAIGATLWADAAGTLRLQRLTAFGPGHCAWLKQTIGAVPGAETCRGTNRRAGDHGHEMFYCLATEDGAQRVWVDCSRDTPKVGGGTADELELWTE